MPTYLPSRFGSPELLEVRKDDQFGWMNTISYTSQVAEKRESIVFILNNGKGAWGNAPRPDTTDLITIDGASGKLYYSSAESTSGNPEYVVTWQQQGQNYEIKAPSSRMTQEEIIQIIGSMDAIK